MNSKNSKIPKKLKREPTNRRTDIAGFRVVCHAITYMQTNDDAQIERKTEREKERKREREKERKREREKERKREREKERKRK